MVKSTKVFSFCGRIYGSLSTRKHQINMFPSDSNLQYLERVLTCFIMMLLFGGGPACVGWTRRCAGLHIGAWARLSGRIKIFLQPQVRWKQIFRRFRDKSSESLLTSSRPKAPISCGLRQMQTGSETVTTRTSATNTDALLCLCFADIWATEREGRPNYCRTSGSGAGRVSFSQSCYCLSCLNY